MHVQLLVIQRLLYVEIYFLYYFSQILLAIGLKLCKSEIVDIQPAVSDLLLKKLMHYTILVTFLK